MKQGILLAPGMEIGYVSRDARKWETVPERTSKFDAVYYRELLKKARAEVGFVFGRAETTLVWLVICLDNSDSYLGSRLISMTEGP